MRADPKKLRAMWEWPVPDSVKALRGFLGLTRYYRRFIREYGGIASPLTDLLKKDGIRGSKEVENFFTKLKQAMVNPQVLTLPNFTLPFEIECDASKKAMETV